MAVCVLERSGVQNKGRGYFWPNGAWTAVRGTLIPQSVLVDKNK